jgi:hypothetical protein
MSEKAEETKTIIKQLDKFSLIDRVEILANVLMFLGASGIDAPGTINQNNIAEIVLKDRKSNGETIANALALQGLTMMLWLQE